MPTYTGICPQCGEVSKIAKVADRDNLTCSGDKEPHPELAIPRKFEAPMVGAMGHTGGSFNLVSPIDGTTIHGRSEYYAHMKKHKVVPESDMRGHAEHVQKRKAAERKADLKKAAEDAFRVHRNK